MASRRSFSRLCISDNKNNSCVFLLPPTRWALCCCCLVCAGGWPRTHCCVWRPGWRSGTVWLPAPETCGSTHRWGSNSPEGGDTTKSPSNNNYLILQLQWLKGIFFPSCLPCLFWRFLCILILFFCTIIYWIFIAHLFMYAIFVIFWLILFLGIFDFYAIYYDILFFFLLNFVFCVFFF